MTIAIILTAIMLLVGWAMRMTVPLFRWLYIPASVIAGFIALASVQWAASSDSELAVVRLTTLAAEHWQAWPGVLIAVVFAGMLLERQPASLRNSLHRAGREGLMVWIIVLGQTGLGLLATWLLVQPLYGLDIPAAFGMLIETGFAGGHGTAAAMGQVFANEQVGLAAGLDLGVMMATIGLVYGVISGVVWVNLGVRCGWTRRAEVTLTAESDDLAPLGRAVVRSDVLDPLWIPAIWLAIAFGLGMVLQWGVNSLTLWWFPPVEDALTDPLAQRTDVAAVVRDFPLFIYTLFGGLMVRYGLQAIGLERLIDPISIGRLTSAAMDALVVAAIATLNLTAVGQRAGAIMILVLVAAVWTAVCLIWLSRWILPSDHWFELGIINYGMSTGTTATGFVLLRMIDPDLDSGAAEDYALAAPLSSPFVGGGMLTIGLPLVVLTQFPLGAVAITLCVLVLALIAGGIWIARRAASSRFESR